MTEPTAYERALQAEIHAIRRIAAAMDLVDKPARHRILEWFTEEYADPELPLASTLAGRGGTAMEHRRYGITDDLLRETARLYRHAVDAGLAPRLYIAEIMHKSPSTISTWLEQARRRTDPMTGRPFLARRGSDIRSAP